MWVEKLGLLRRGANFSERVVNAFRQSMPLPDFSHHLTGYVVSAAPLACGNEKIGIYQRLEIATGEIVGNVG